MAVNTAQAGWARRRPGQIGTTFAPVAPTPQASAPADDPFNQFDDPATHQLEELIKRQMGTLSQPYHDQTSDDVMAMFRKQIADLQGSAPVSYDMPGDFFVGNDLLGDFITEGRKRIGELNERPFSDAEEAALKTRTRNDQVVARDAAKQRVVEDAARRGLGESSGVLQEGLQGQERAFTAADAKSQNDLMLWIADQIQQRKDKATSIAGSLASAGEAQAGRAQAGKIAGGQMRLQGQIAATSANQARQGQIMSLAGALADMAAQQRGEARGRQQDVLALSTLLSQLPVQRLQLMMSVLNGTGGNNIPDLFKDVSTLNNSQEYAHANDPTNGFLEALAALGKYYADRGKK